MIEIFSIQKKINKNIVVVSPGDFNAWSDSRITVMKRIPWSNK